MRHSLANFFLPSTLHGRRRRGQRAQAQDTRAWLLRMLGLALLVTFAVASTRPVYAATITVNTTADENGSGAGCSLREAITAANTNAAFGGCPAGAAGADVISLPAGTYQLTLANAGGVNEDNNATGDLDVLESLTIQGAGSGSTIIQAGTTSTNGIDKVFALNPICTSPINVTIDGVTIRFGRNSQPFGAADFSFTGGGIDWCANGSGSVFTLSNAVVSDNTNVNAYGGGLNVDSSGATSFTVNITNATFQNNRTLSAVNESNGGAVNLFGSGFTVNITNSTFSGNQTTNATSGGGAIYFRPTTASALSISGSTFSTNTAAGIGGALATNTFGAGTTIAIQNSTFSGNTATNAFGGALNFGSTNLNTTPFALSHLKITGNSAGQAGGGVYVGSSNVTLSKSLIVGNNAPTGKGLHKSVDAATATATSNWWGCSTGPGAAPCDTATTAGGTLSFTPWYRDQLTAGTAPIVTNQSTALTASFLTNSANSAVPLADLAEIIGRSVTWAATLGNLSGTQGTVQAAGTATGSFQATAAGTAIISAKVDNDNTAPVSSNVLSLTVNKADTTATITSDTPDPTVTGQPYTVGYSVGAAFGVSPTAPTGNVVVSDGTNTCSGTVAAGQCTLTSFTAGNKTLTATYQGDSNFNASPASAGVAHTVNKADTTATITSDNPDPSVVGQSVTFAYNVTVNAPGSGTPTGNVTVSDGGSNSCTATVAAGSCTITFTSPGDYNLTATYAGDANYNASPASANVSHHVDKANTTTTITSDTPDPSNVGQSVTVQYTVTVNAPGAGTPTGNVTVSDGVDSCTGTVASGTCNIALTTPGARTLTATYAGDSNFNGSTSAGEPHTVNRIATTTTITSDTPDPSVVGQSVTIQYSVTPGGAGTPTGNVTVSDGTTSCTGTVAAGQCSLTFTSAGVKSLTATYAGDSNFDGSTSAAEAHQVNKADTTTTTTSDSPDPSVVGESVTVQYSVLVNSPGSGTPTGNVTVGDGTISCTGTVVAGQCALTFTSAGAKSLTATYAGDSNFNGSTSASESHTVNAADTTTTIASDNPDPSAVGQAVTVQYQVSANAPGAGTPTGNVTVGDGTISCTGTVAAGQCLLTFTSAGAKSLTATYAGDSNFNGSTSAAEPHTVNGIGTTTTITSDNPDPSVVGQSVTVQYNVTSGGGTPTGNVTVSDGTISCTGTVAAGQCSLTLTSAGVKSLTATYAGDSNFSGSTSAAEPHQVNKADTTTAITIDSPDPSAQGSAVTVQYQVTANAPGSGTPTGNVTVSDGVDSCTGTVAAGQCSITLTTVGNRTLTATYAGDSNFNGSTSAGEPHTVNPPNSAPTYAVTNGQCSGTNPASGTINLTLHDPDGDPLTLTFVSNSNPTLVPNSNIVLGGSGTDRTLTVTAAQKKDGTATLTFDLSDGTVTVQVVVTVIVGTGKGQTLNGTSGTDMIFGINGKNTINGNDGNDLLCGGNGNDTINGGKGDDIIDGKNGNDALNGGDGNDTINGGNGDDVIDGGDGDDTLTGGMGADFFSGGTGTDIVTDFNVAQGDTKDGTIP